MHKCILLLLLVNVLNSAEAQDWIDSSYISKIDSARDSPRRPSFKRQETVDKTHVEYTYLKNDKSLRVAIEHNRPQKILILYLYMDDKLVQISPVGQQPYYIRDNKFIFSRHSPLDQAEINVLIERGNLYQIRGKNLLTLKKLTYLLNNFF